MCAATNDGEFNDIPFIGQEKTGDVSSKVDVLVDYYGHIDNKGTDNDWNTLGIPQVVFKIANSWMSEEALQGFDDFQSFWLRKNVSDMTQEEYAAADPYFYIEENLPMDLAVWIVHGDCDIKVPYLESERLAETLSGKLGEDAVSYHLIPDMGHANDPLYSDLMLGGLEEFLEMHIKE